MSREITTIDTTTTHTHGPRVWAGCLHCHVSGRLVGAWYDCTAIADNPEAYEVARIHRDGGYPAELGCKELWCFDIELIPIGCEIDLAEAARWGECFQELDSPELWPALCDWVAVGMHTENNYGMPDVPTFMDEYCGHWDSWQNYAKHLIDETVEMNSWPGLAQRYFNYESYARDIKFDYSVKDSKPYTGEPGVYIFRNY